MKKNRNKKLLSLIFLIVFSFTVQTIAYSAINGTLTIKGKSYARKATDVRITDFNLSKTSTGGISLYEEFSKDTVSSTIRLPVDSESIIYDIEVTNYGNTNIGIYNITGIPSNLNYELINYNLKDKICDESNKCNNLAKKTFQIKFTGTPGDYEFTLNFDFRIFHEVTYTGIENKSYPTEILDGETLQITFKENLKRIKILSNNTQLAFHQNISNGQTLTYNNIHDNINIKYIKPVAELKSGTTKKTGSNICVENQCFYLFENNGTTLKLFSKYNLHTAYIYDGVNRFIPLENPTGIQESNAIGWWTENVSASNPFIGVIDFSSTNYWSNITEYPTYVYNSQSYLYSHIENYKTYLQNKDLFVNNARLINVNEIVKLGCVLDDRSCSGAPSWVHGTTYWTGSASSEARLWRVLIGGDLNGRSYDISYDYGIRPVIEINADEIYANMKLKSGDLDTIGSEVCVLDECFYVISSTEDDVTMLSKYALYIGNECTTSTSSTCTAYGSKATGLQNSTMLGHGATPRKGTIAFSSDSQKGTNYSDYDGSIAQKYALQYHSYLKSLNLDIKETRIISVEELERLGCSKAEETCINAPKWVYNVPHWTQTAYSSTYIWRVATDITLTTRGYNLNSSQGIRPVITVPKNIII